MRDTAVGVGRTVYDASTVVTYGVTTWVAPEQTAKAYGPSVERMDQLLDGFTGGKGNSGFYRVTSTLFNSTIVVFGGEFGQAGRLGRAGAAADTVVTAEGAVAKTGGRLGSASTRQLNSAIAGKLEQHGWEITGGGGRAPETFLPGAGPGTKGGNFTDITAVRNGEVLHVNTVSTLADGVTPTAQEAAAAAAIRAKLGAGEKLILVPKKP
jgi:hypothetical protein